MATTWKCVPLPPSSRVDLMKTHLYLAYLYTSLLFLEWNRETLRNAGRELRCHTEDHHEDIVRFILELIIRKTQCVAAYEFIRH